MEGTLHTRIHDLEQLRNKIIAEYFSSGARVPNIEWAARRTSRSMGSYDAAAGTITVNPLLNDAAVPEYYVLYVIYHEMLHAYLPPLVRGGRTIHHHRLFKVREREFREIDRALRWELEDLPHLHEKRR